MTRKTLLTFPKKSKSSWGRMGCVDGKSMVENYLNRVPPNRAPNCMVLLLKVKWEKQRKTIILHVFKVHH